MSTHVYLFKPQFAPLVEAGTKLQTVRPLRKRMPKAGDALSLRTWTGLPYRSKQRVLRSDAVCIKVTPFWFNSVSILLEDPVTATSLMPAADQEAFARADGFASLREMADWFESEHGLPFIGFVTYWQPLEASR